ncbi:hypothetical protein BDW66DRAFT_144433 [Aspergillus desertorum]
MQCSMVIFVFDGNPWSDLSIPCQLLMVFIRTAVINIFSASLLGYPTRKWRGQRSHTGQQHSTCPIC